MKENLIKISSLYAAHEGITHWAVSVRLMKKGDFFSKLHKGADCWTSTYERTMQWFSDRWLADLPWPSDISRPPCSKDDAA